MVGNWASLPPTEAEATDELYRKAVFEESRFLRRYEKTDLLLRMQTAQITAKPQNIFEAGLVYYMQTRVMFTTW